MKFLFGSFLLLSLSAYGEVQVNKSAEASTMATENGLKNSSGITTDELNPSPNPAPESEAEVIDNTTLTNEPIETGPYGEGQHIPGKDEIEAQEDAMDYSTTPEERPDTQPNPNKIGN